VRKYIVTILIVIAILATGLMVLAPRPVSLSAAVQQVSFSTNDPSNLVSMNSSVFVTYDDTVNIYGNDGSTVSYNLQPGDLVLTLNLRLSSLDLNLPDETITVSVADTQLIDQEISLTQYLTSVPPALASIDLVIRTKVSMAPPSTSSPYCSVATSSQSLMWSHWGSKTFSIDSSEDGWIRTGLTYQLSVGVVADALDLLTDRLSVTLIPDIDLTTTSGSDPLVTMVDIQGGPAPANPQSILYPVMWVMIVAVAVVAVLAYVFPLVKKRIAPISAGSPSPVPVQEGIKYCGSCGQQVSRGATYCPICGRLQR
jgi:hypothetical protein